MKRIFLICAGTLLFASNVHARIKVIGNGGDVITCQNRLPETLDSWEGRLSGLRYDFTGLPSDYRARARAILERLAIKSEAQAHRLGQELDYVLANLVFLNDVELEDIPDSSHTLLPEGCELKQLGAFVRTEPAEYRGKVAVDQMLFDQLSQEQKTWFVLHEAAYRRLVEDEKEVDSRRARKVLQKIASNAFAELPQFEQWRQLALLGLDRVAYGGLVGWAVASVQNMRNVSQKMAYKYSNGLDVLARADMPLSGELMHSFFRVTQPRDSFVKTLVPMINNSNDLPELPAEGLLLTFVNEIQISSSGLPVTVHSHGGRTIRVIQFAPNAAGKYFVNRIEAEKMVVRLGFGADSELFNYGNLEIIDGTQLRLDSVVGVEGLEQKNPLGIATRHYERRWGPSYNESLYGPDFISMIKELVLGPAQRYPPYASAGHFNRMSLRQIGYLDPVTGQRYQGHLLIDLKSRRLVQSLDPDGPVVAPPGSVSVKGASEVLRLRRGQFYGTDERYLLATYPRRDCKLLFHEDGRLVEFGAKHNTCQTERW